MPNISLITDYNEKKNALDFLLNSLFENVLDSVCGVKSPAARFHGALPSEEEANQVNRS